MPPRKKQAARNSVKTVVKNYAETTYTKGIPRIFKSKSTAARILWFLAVVFGGSIALYQVISLVEKYLNYPTATNIVQRFNISDFPDVTICNKHPMTRSHYLSVSPAEFFDELGAFFNQFNDTHALFNSNMPKVNMTEEEFDEIAAMTYSLAGYFQSIPIETVDFRQQIHDLFVDCVFYTWDMGIKEGLTCYDLEFRPFFFPDHKACYTLQVPEQYKNEVRGYSLVLNLHQNFHATYPLYRLHMAHSMSPGARVWIHPRGVLPDPQDGYTVGPGKETTVRINPLHLSFLPQPHGDCSDQLYLDTTQHNITSLWNPQTNYTTDDSPDDEKTSAGYVFNYSRPLYTSDTCLSLCHQREIVEACNCIDPIFLVSPIFAQEYGDLDYCGNTSVVNYNGTDLKLNITLDKIIPAAERLHCAIRMHQKMNDDTCDCPQACHQTYYPRTVTQSPFPLKDQQVAFVVRYILGTDFELEYIKYLGLLYYHYDIGSIDADTLHGYLEDMNKIERNFLQLNVLFDSKMIEEIVEEALITWDILFGNIGGSFNLWIGISFVTIIEVIELIFNVIQVKLVKEKTSKRKMTIAPLDGGNI